MPSHQTIFVVGCSFNLLMGKRFFHFRDCTNLFYCSLSRLPHHVGPQSYWRNNFVKELRRVPKIYNIFSKYRAGGRSRCCLEIFRKFIHFGRLKIDNNKQGKIELFSQWKASFRMHYHLNSSFKGKTSLYDRLTDSDLNSAGQWQCSLLSPTQPRGNSNS